MLFSNLQRSGLQLAEKKYYKTPKNTIIELRSSLMNLFFETDTIPSAAPAFAKLPSMASYFKIAPSLRNFEAAHSGSNRVYEIQQINVKYKRSVI